MTFDDLRRGSRAHKVVNDKDNSFMIERVSSSQADTEAFNVVLGRAEENAAAGGYSVIQKHKSMDDPWPGYDAAIISRP